MGAGDVLPRSAGTRVSSSTLPVRVRTGIVVGLGGGVLVEAGGDVGEGVPAATVVVHRTAITRALLIGAPARGRPRTPRRGPRPVDRHRGSVCRHHRRAGVASRCRAASPRPVVPVRQVVSAGRVASMNPVVSPLRGRRSRLRSVPARRVRPESLKASTRSPPAHRLRGRRVGPRVPRRREGPARRRWSWRCTRRVRRSRRRNGRSRPWRARSRESP